MVYVEPEIQEKIIKLHIQEGRTLTSLSDEFGISRGIITRLIKRYRDEAKENIKQSIELADMEALRKLQKEVEELRKENDFLKKAAAFFAKESK
jgi:transposase